VNSISASNSKPVYFQKKGGKPDSYDNGISEINESIHTKPKAKNMANNSMMVSPTNSNFTTKRKLGGTSTTRPGQKRNRLNKSMVSSSDGMHRFGNTTMKQYLNKKAKMNPLIAIETDIKEARYTIQKSQRCRQQSDEVGDDQLQLVLLNKENIILRDELKAMNNNLNSFIDVLKDYKNLKTTRQKFMKPDNSTKEVRMRAKGAEKKTYQQIMTNMKEEHKRVKKRLEVVGDPSYA
jgi:hypothetical protein